MSPSCCAVLCWAAPRVEALLRAPLRREGGIARAHRASIARE